MKVGVAVGGGVMVSVMENDVERVTATCCDSVMLGSIDPECDTDGFTDTDRELVRV